MYIGRRTKGTKGYGTFLTTGFVTDFGQCRQGAETFFMGKTIFFISASTVCPLHHYKSNIVANMKKQFLYVNKNESMLHVYWENFSRRVL